MNITEANDTNTVLRYLLGLPNLTGDVPTDDQAQDAAERLAEKAAKALHAGLRPVDVAQAWHRVQVCPAEEPA